MAEELSASARSLVETISFFKISDDDSSMGREEPKSVQKAPSAQVQPHMQKPKTPAGHITGGHVPSSPASAGNHSTVSDDDFEEF